MHIYHASFGGGVIAWRQSADPFIPATMKNGRKYSVVAHDNPVSINNTLANGLASVTKDLTLTYTILGTVEKDYSISYNIINAVEKDLALAYNIVNSIVKDLVLAYSISGTVEKDFTLSYEIVSAGTVVKDFAFSYSILGAVEKDLDIEYSVFNSVEKDLTLTYSVISSVIKNLLINYSIQAEDIPLPHPLADTRIYKMVPDAPNIAPNIPTYYKDPDETLDYGFDAVDILAQIPEDSVATFSINANCGMQVVASDVSETSLYGALVTAGYNQATGMLTCRLTMASGRIIESSIFIKIGRK